MGGARESTLWTWLKTGAQEYAAPQLHLQRIENAIAKGTPDVEGCIRGVCFWLELKAAARPKRASTPVRTHIDYEQLAWLKQRTAAGGIALMLLRVGSGPSRSIYLIDWRTACELHAGACTEQVLQFRTLVDRITRASQVLAHIEGRQQNGETT